MQFEAVLWWQNHFGITLSQLLEHRYHVMHISLPDKRNVVNNFCRQAFLSEQSFPSLSMSFSSSSTVILLFFKLHSSCWYRLELRSGFLVSVGLVHDTEYFPFQGLSRLPIQISYYVNFRNVLSFYLICQ